MTRLLFWIGDLFERGVSNGWPIHRREALCYHVSQWFYRTAWRIGKLG